jgi:hypothetical protein
MAAFSVCRIVFLLFNPSLLQGQTAVSLIKVMLAGFRFDAFSSVAILSFFIAGHLHPGQAFFSPAWQRLLKILFYLFTIPALLFNLIDCIYFRYSRKRTTADFFTSEITGDLKFNITSYLLDFWFLLVILVVLVFLMEKAYRRIHPVRQRLKLVPYITGALAILFLSVVAIRGGLQFKPISMQGMPPRK